MRALRAQQFPEDAGPLAHPVRPEVYHEINNFYTATVYEKGAEVVRMLKTLLGRETFRKGMDLYFERHDGEAATVEDFVQCFADATGRDLTQFMRWYSQAGTPEVVAARHATTRSAKTYRLDLVADRAADARPAVEGADAHPARARAGRRATAATCRSSLPTASSIERGVITLTKPSEAFVFDGRRGAAGAVAQARLFGAGEAHRQSLRRRPALPRGARQRPVQPLAGGADARDAAARRQVARAPRRRSAASATTGLLDALAAILADDALEPAFVAQVLTLPGEADIAREIGRDVDPDAIFRRARRCARRSAGICTRRCRGAYRRPGERGPYSPDAGERRPPRAAQRCLDLLAATGDPTRRARGARSTSAPTT